jgi:hypothetical protein
MENSVQGGQQNSQPPGTMTRVEGNGAGLLAKKRS